ncbi:MAG: EAL domain-containing protein [Alphaproteobacteria bacterium]|nr:EAL domain-containing protein [Alphaproteobacteria bacterium]
MQETSNVAVVNEEAGSQAGPDSPRDEALGYADKASLQSTLMELILNEGTSGDCFDKALEQIRYSFDAEGCAVVPVNQAGETCIQELRYAMPGASDPAVINFFSNVDSKHAYAHFRLQESMMPGDESALSGDYWCEELRDVQTDKVHGYIYLLFFKTCEFESKDKLVFFSINPLVCLFLQSLERIKALPTLNIEGLPTQHEDSQFASLAETIPGVVYQRRVRPDGDIRYEYISQSAQDLFGVSAQEILTNPKALFNVFAPEYRDTFRRRLIDASKTLETWDVEASIVTTEGEKKYTHAIAHPEAQPDGSVLWTGVILDATRIKQAETEAAETEARTRSAIVESLSQGLLMYDADDKLILSNSHFIALYPDIAETAVVGASYADIVKAELCCGADSALSTRSLQGRIDERLDHHNSTTHSVIERQLSDDCWVQINEHRAPEGGTVVLYTDVTEIKKREARIHHMALHDGLTGLPNRVLFRTRVEQALAQARRYGTNIAVICLDLDHFKNVNDTLGHPAGDMLLRTVSDRLKIELREIDTIARLGGDEFAIVLADFEDIDIIHNIARRVLSSLSKPIDMDGQEAIVGASLGIALSSGDCDEPDRLLKNADLALYRAKEDGRNTYRFFAREMDELALARRQIEIDLRQALGKSQLQLYFQPLINMSVGEITGFEALIRWNHPERGLVSPDDFIQIAEETGLIMPVGEWVLRNACEIAASWAKPVKVAVNLSPAQFKQPGLVKLVSETLEATGLPPERLELEITETVLLKNTNETMEVLYRLKGLGVRIAMDDFGTGYSSLGNLRSFPFDKIKIDRSFVSDLETNSEAAAIVRAVVGLGRSLGIDTTAEGVETKDQLTYLRIEGCSEAQGFYYSRPRPQDEIPWLLEQDIKSLAEGEGEVLQAQADLVVLDEA